jgi:hypothetical protein
VWLPILVHISRNWSIWILKLPVLRVEEEKERGNIVAQFVRIPTVTERGFGVLFFRHARRKHRKDLNGFLVWLKDLVHQGNSLRVLIWSNQL